MAWELDNKGSIYGQLVDVITRRIVTGVYPAGSRLPSVRDFAHEAGVNPNTMQRAMAELERSGIIVASRTSGKTVTGNAEMIETLRTDMAKDMVAGLFKDMKELGFKWEEIKEIIDKEGNA